MQRLKDTDFLSALVLFFIGAVSLSQAGTDVRNWIFPRLATYLILAIAVVLLARVVFAAAMKRVPDIIHWVQEDRAVLIDVVVFCAIVLAYMFVMRGLGFWLSSFRQRVQGPVSRCRACSTGVSPTSSSTDWWMAMPRL